MENKVYAIGYYYQGESKEEILGTALFATRTGAEDYIELIKGDYDADEYDFMAVELLVH